MFIVRDVNEATFKSKYRKTAVPSTKGRLVSERLQSPDPELKIEVKKIHIQQSSLETRKSMIKTVIAKVSYGFILLASGS